MRNVLLSALVCMFICTSCGESVTETKSYNQGINIIPMPDMMTTTEGQFKLTNKTVLYAQNAEAKTVAEFFCN